MSQATDAQRSPAMPEDATPAIAHSWQRCQARGAILPAPPATPSDDLRALLAVIRPMIEDVAQYVEGSPCVIAVADVRGVIAEVVGDPAVAADLAPFGVQPGAWWDEERRGTNALALALIEAFPMLVVGDAHFHPDLRPLFAAAAPIFDGLGLPVGGVAIIGRREHCHPHSLGMAGAAAQAITNQLQTNLWLSDAQERLSELTTMLQTLSEGVVLLDRDGVVSQMNARAGKLLGIVPARALGRHLRDLGVAPPALSHALAHGHDLQDEEIAFEVGGNRVACLCTLKAITAPVAALGAVRSVPGSAPAMLVAPALSGGWVLSLRPIERMQRIVHRMSGARARMTFADIIGGSPAMADALRLARIAAGSDVTVLLRGETGVGKELFAQSIHTAGDRADGPFVAINCAAIPRELITSELFGYEGGAFTGADRQGRPGKFELAHHGTLFLDEIGDMPRDLQTTLLRALETRTITRIGGQQVIQVDVRIIAATHKPLEADVASGAFRSDLFYRLNVFSIVVPPLRDRQSDIPALIQQMLRRHSRTLGRAVGIVPEALAALGAHPWPGNVRELENTIERAVYIADGGMIALDHLPREVRTVSPPAPTPPAFAAPTPGVVPAPALRAAQAQHETAVIRQAIAQCDGNLTAAARLLGISRTTLWRHRARLHDSDA